MMMKPMAGRRHTDQYLREGWHREEMSTVQVRFVKSGSRLCKMDEYKIIRELCVR